MFNVSPTAKVIFYGDKQHIYKSLIRQTGGAGNVFVWFDSLRPSQTAMVMSGQSVHFFLGILD